MSHNIPEEVRETFATPDRFIGEHECKRLTDLSRVTRWRLMRRNEFPQKVSISPNRKGWTLSSLLNWVAQRAATA